MPVDAVDAAAQLVRAEAEGERALEPHRLRRVLLQALVVANERGARLRVELALVAVVAEPGPPPSRVEQVEQPSSSEPPAEWWRSSTWCTTIPKRWWIVCSVGMRRTRANL